MQTPAFTSRWDNYWIEGILWLARNLDIDGIYLDGAPYERSVLRRLRNIHAAVVHSGALTVHLTADAPSLASTAPEIAQLVQALPSAAPAGPRFAWAPLEPATDEAFV